ncbi:MAG TPA: serine/threonine-protein kinase [Chthoniobacteraceae bacterium]|nr:serine/threonine-protein kinase [Chthoniobacteraceae bacterium]
MPDQTFKNSAPPGAAENASGWQPLPVERVAHLFPQYAILGLLGRGAIGAVYHGFEAATEQNVAIRILPRANSMAPEVAQNFANALPRVAGLAHGHVVAMRAFGLTADDHLFLITDFVEGTTLRERIRSRTLTPPQVLSMIEQVCDGLHHAHGKNIRHGTLHPGNVFIDRHGPVKVADFAMAELGLPDAAMDDARDYFAPERINGGRLNRRADIYSAGVMLYEALTGELPHADSPPASELVAVNPRIDAVIARAMSSSPDGRYQTSAEMMHAIAAVRTIAVQTTLAATAPVEVGPKTAARKKRLPLWAGAAGAVALGAAGMFAWHAAGNSRGLATPKPAIAEWPTLSAPAPAATPVATPPPLALAKPAAAKAPAASTPKPASAKPAPAKPAAASAPPPAGVWIPIPLDAKINGASALEGGGIHLTKSTKFTRFQARDIAIRATIRLTEDAKAAQLWLRQGAVARGQIVLDGKPSCFIQTTLGEGKFRSFGSVMAPWAIIGDRWVTVEFGAVDKKLFGAANGRAIAVQDPCDVNDAGTVGIFSTNADFKDLAVMILDDVPPERYPDFIKTALGPALAKATPETAPAAIEKPAAAMPAPAAPKASADVEKWLAQVDGPYQEEYRRDVAAPFENGVGELRKSYLATLERQIVQASQASKLEEALAWRNERQRFFESGQNVPADDSDNPLAAIKPLRAGFRVQFAKLERERVARARVKFATYDGLLSQNQNVLTQRQRLDDAMLLKAKREELAKVWLAPAAAAPPPVASGAAGGTQGK